MSDNPLEPDAARDDQIRRRAYHLWEADGRPSGRDAEYWERATELVGLEDSAGAGQLPNPSTQPGADPYRTEPVEEAFLQDNLGEFPDRFSDQAEVQVTPSRQQSGMKPDDTPSPGAAGEAADSPSAKAAKAKAPASKKPASVPKEVTSTDEKPKPKRKPPAKA